MKALKFGVFLLWLKICLLTCISNLQVSLTYKADIGLELSACKIPCYSVALKDALLHQLQRSLLTQAYKTSFYAHMFSDPEELLVLASRGVLS